MQVIEATSVNWFKNNIKYIHYTDEIFMDCSLFVKFSASLVLTIVSSIWA